MFDLRAIVQVIKSQMPGNYCETNIINRSIRQSMFKRTLSGVTERRLYVALKRQASDRTHKFSASHLPIFLINIDSIHFQMVGNNANGQNNNNTA